ncbi:MAG: DUF6048 family protein, partial [Phocaeicola sp.]
TPSQVTKNTAANLEEKKVPFYQGLNIGIDLLGIGSKLFGGNILSSEVSLEANLKNRYIPVIELGYAKAEATHEETQIYYKTTAPYFRVGANYNILYNKPYLPGYLFVGARVGYTSFSYDVITPGAKDPIWGEIIPVAYENVKSQSTWGEVVIGIKTELFKGVCMGLSARWKIRFNSGKALNSEPWYTPGFGSNNSSTFGFTYNLSYNLPF